MTEPCASEALSTAVVAAPAADAGPARWWEPPRQLAAVEVYFGWSVVALAFALPCRRDWVSILAALAMVLWLCDGRLKSKLRQLVVDPLWGALLLFIAVNLLSLLWSDHPGDGWDYLTKYRYLLLAPMLATSLDRRFVRPAFAAFAAGASVAVALLFSARAGLLVELGVTPLNPAVTMSHLDLSMVLAVATLLALVRLAASGLSQRQRLAWLAASLVAGAGLLVNIGRSGQLAFFVAFAVAVFSRLGRGSWWRAPAAIAVTVAILIAAVVAVPSFRNHASTARQEITAALVDGVYDTNQGKRIAGIIVAGDIVRDHPLLGTGVGDTMVEFRRRLDTEHSALRAAVAWFPHLHNQYVQVATELGLLGLVALLNIFVQLFRRRFELPAARSAAIVVAVAYLVGFLGDPYFHKQLPLATFAVVVGLLCGVDGRAAGSEQG